MNEIIQNLEANATNGYEQFCYIDEKMLEAMKELSKRENEEKINLEHNWNELKKWLEEQKENFQFAGDFGEFNTNIEDLEIVLDKIKELEEGGNNE